MVDRLYENGNGELRGHLLTVVENGLLKEFKNSRVTWMGYYSTHSWYSEVFERDHLKGIYVERSIKDRVQQLEGVSEHPFGE